MSIIDKIANDPNISPRFASAVKCEPTVTDLAVQALESAKQRVLDLNQWADCTIALELIDEAIAECKTAEAWPPLERDDDER